jgi:putative membrane protein
MSDLKDPRVLFAAERTLLAWNRTSISWMAFGFVIERFGLFLELAGKAETVLFQRHVSFIIGESFVVLASFVSIYSILQYTRILRTLHPAEIPKSYNLRVGVISNAVIGALGFALSAYLATAFM